MYAFVFNYYYPPPIDWSAGIVSKRRIKLWGEDHAGIVVKRNKRDYKKDYVQTECKKTTLLIETELIVWVPWWSQEGYRCVSGGY